MPGELERLIQAMLQPQRQVQNQRIAKMAVLYDPLATLAESVAVVYPLPAAQWQVSAADSRWGECQWG